MYLSDGKAARTLRFIAGTNGSTRGAMMVISAGKAVKAAAAHTAATVLGIAKNTVAADGIVEIEMADDRLVTAAYTGSSKTSLADTDIGTVFDLSDSVTVNLDDTTGGMCICQGYDNTAKTITFVIPEASKYC